MIQTDYDGDGSHLQNNGQMSSDDKLVDADQYEDGVDLIESCDLQFELPHI